MGGYEMTVVPNFSDCFFMFSMISGPMMPSGNPGKFSRSVVVVSWPPAQEKTQNGIHIVGNWGGLDNRQETHQQQLLQRGIPQRE